MGPAPSYGRTQFLAGHDRAIEPVDYDSTSAFSDSGLISLWSGV
jgi:hypothetical protein